MHLNRRDYAHVKCRDLYDLAHQDAAAMERMRRRSVLKTNRRALAVAQARGKLIVEPQKLSPATKVEPPFSKAHWEDHWAKNPDKVPATGKTLGECFANYKAYVSLIPSLPCSCSCWFVAGEALPMVSHESLILFRLRLTHFCRSCAGLMGGIIARRTR